MQNLHEKFVAVSGGFDPIHAGHVRMFRASWNYGPVLVILNSDDWLMRKKGFVFHKWEERAEILNSIAYVSKITRVDDTDNTVCEALRRERPKYFANGGDRTEYTTPTPEMEVCKELGIELLWGIGGGKVNSSSILIKQVMMAIGSPYTERPWGGYEVLQENELSKVKILTIKPGQKISNQRHMLRSELWTLLSGDINRVIALNMTTGHSQFLNQQDYFRVRPDHIHTAMNIGSQDARILEIQLGICSEDDIIREGNPYPSEIINDKKSSK